MTQIKSSMPAKKIDTLVAAVTGLLLAGLLIITFLPVRDLVIPHEISYWHVWEFYVRMFLVFQLVGVFSILGGLGLLLVERETLKRLGVLSWTLGMAVALFVFLSVFYLRLERVILPFYAKLGAWGFSPRIIIPIAVFGAGILFISRWKNRRYGPGGLMVVVGFSFLLNLAVVAANPSFVTNVTRTFRNKHNEYYNDIAKVDRAFVFDYAAQMPRLTLHGKTHPPLATLFLSALDWMGLGMFGASVATVLIGSLTVVFVYMISRDLFGAAAARAGASLFWLVPGVVLYSAVSMDAFFMFLCAAAIFFFQRSMGKIHYVPLFALSFSLALYSTFVAGILLILFAAWVVLGLLKGSLPEDAYRNLALGGGLIVLLHLGLYWGLNYNIMEVFFRAWELNAKIMAPLPAKPYGYWIVGNLVDYFTFLGLPLFSAVCLYGWQLKKKLPRPISLLRRLFSPYLFLTSPV